MIPSGSWGVQAPDLLNRMACHLKQENMDASYSAFDYLLMRFIDDERSAFDAFDAPQLVLLCRDPRDFGSRLSKVLDGKIANKSRFLKMEGLMEFLSEEGKQ